MPSFCEKPHATNLALYPMMFPSTTWWNYELSFMYRYCILDIILLELIFPFFLEGSATLVILVFILKCCHLFFRTSLILLFLYVIFPTSQMHLYCWKHFIKNVHTGKLLCINIWSCNYFSQYISHKNFSRCLPSLPGQHWYCALIQYVSKEVSL